MDIITLLKPLSGKIRDYPAIDRNDLKATYQELIEDAHTVYLAFKKLKVKKGDIICISFPSNYQVIVLFLALNELSAITTFLDSYASKEEIVISSGESRFMLLGQTQSRKKLSNCRMKWRV